MTTCVSVDPVSKLPCEKQPGHDRFTDGRGLHRATEPHVGLIRETYRATWVHVWGFRHAK